MVPARYKGPCACSAVGTLCVHDPSRPMVERLPGTNRGEGRCKK